MIDSIDSLIDYRSSAQFDEIGLIRIDPDPTEPGPPVQSYVAANNGITLPSRRVDHSEQSLNEKNPGIADTSGAESLNPVHDNYVAIGRQPNSAVRC